MSEKDSSSEAKQCPECLGRGWTDNLCLTSDHSHRCTLCNGIGKTTLGHDCHACSGTGLIEVRKEDKKPCPVCNGAGVFPVPESMTMKEFAYAPGIRKRKQ